MNRHGTKKETSSSFSVLVADSASEIYQYFVVIAVRETAQIQYKSFKFFYAVLDKKNPTVSCLHMYV